MDKVESADGTSIAFERMGAGPPLILVCGASCPASRMHPTAAALGRHFDVINYDRRGRGESGDTVPYAVEREVEDIAALIAEAGGGASLYGHSSGAALALHAVASGLPVDALIMHDPPYSPADPEMRADARRYGEELRATLAENRRGDAMALFMAMVGMPPEMIDGARRNPHWGGMEALAPTLAYDSEVMGDVASGGAVPEELVAAAGLPTLVLVGGESPPFMLDVGSRIAELLPDGRFRILECQDHAADPEAVAPVLAEFLGAARSA